MRPTMISFTALRQLHTIYGTVPGRTCGECSSFEARVARSLKRGIVRTRKGSCAVADRVHWNATWLACGKFKPRGESPQKVHDEIESA